MRLCQYAFLEIRVCVHLRIFVYRFKYIYEYFDGNMHICTDVCINKKEHKAKFVRALGMYLPNSLSCEQNVRQDQFSCGVKKASIQSFLSPRPVT